MRVLEQELEELKPFLNKIEFPIISVDWGERRIGLAISDSKGIISFPHKTIEVTTKKTTQDIINDIKRIIKEFKIKTILIGLPHTNPKSQNKIKSFTDNLKKNTTLPVIFWDESFSTVEAQNMLISSQRHTKKHKKRIDALAASIFLQDFLNYLNRRRNEQK